MSANRFTKLDADGNAMPSDAVGHVMVLDNTTGLMWPAETIGNTAVNHAEAEQLVRECRIGGYKWDMPTVEQLLTLVDRTRIRPAIDADAFPGTKNEWYWSSTPYAYSPYGSAWVVGFHNGCANFINRIFGAFIRPVRKAGAK